MFGIEKFDERTQAIALMGGIVVALSITLVIFFLVTIAFVKPQDITQDINPDRSNPIYVYGVIDVTFKEGVKKADVGNLMSNLGLQFSEPVTNPYGRLVYEVKVERGKELFWIKRFKKEPTVYDVTLRKVR